MNLEMTESIKAVQNHYHYLGLSAGQATKVLQWEEIPANWDMDLTVQYFSYWDEQEYTLDRFEKILTDKQFQLLEQDLHEKAQMHAKRLAEQDAKQKEELVRREEWVNWLRDTFVPEVNRSTAPEGILFLFQKEKVKYLRSEYQTFLGIQKRNTLVNHYRHSRRFRPNILKMALLVHEDKRLLPDYTGLLESSDEALKAVAIFVLDKYRSFAKHHEPFLQQKLEEISQQTQRIAEKYPREPIRGWHTTILPKTTFPAEEWLLMSLMLMDN